MSNIKVVVRPRPVDEVRKEKWAAGFEINGRRLTLGTKSYDPDVCLPHTATQDDVFGHALPILDAVKDGSNGTILVYGQTGTGKTHTMIGGTDGYDGITVKAIEYLLDHVRERTLAGRQMALSMSVLEIYNERVTDMLADGDREVLLINGFPRNTLTATISSMDDALGTVRAALNSRHVSATAMNDRSSRSHVIFMLDLAEVTEERTEVAHLFLVDLAGSESIKKSQASGKAAQEAGMINRSLLALKNVILTLSTAATEGPATSRPHVPYRDSRLTELLQDSIGGTARTMFIACISPNGRDLDETKSTLEYATKARSIRNVSSTERDKLHVKIRGLEVEVQKYKNRLQDRLSERGGYFITKEEHEDLQHSSDRLRQAEADVKALLEDKAATQARHNVTASQIGIYRDMLNAKETELQLARSTIAKMVFQFQATVRTSEQAYAATLNNAEARAVGLLESAGQRLQEISTSLDAETMWASNCGGLDDVWADLNERVNDVVQKACDTNLRCVEQLRAAQTAQKQSLRESLSRLGATVASELSRCERDVESASVDMNMELLSVRSTVEPLMRPNDVAPRLAVRHAFENTLEQWRGMISEAAAPPPADALTRDFGALRSGVRSIVSAATREALSHVTSVDVPASMLLPPLPAPGSPASPLQDFDRQTCGGESVLSPSRKFSTTATTSGGNGAATTSQQPNLPARRGGLVSRATVNEAPLQPKRTRSAPSETLLEANRRRAQQPSQ